MLIVARATGEVIWQYGGLWVLNQQHDASMLPSGNVMLFDNGQYLFDVGSSSQVQEIDPRTDTVLWSFPNPRQPLGSFYSSITGGAQRLENGNTLITYGVPARIIEVTPAGDIVWDYHDPMAMLLFKARAYPTSILDATR